MHHKKHNTVNMNPIDQLERLFQASKDTLPRPQSITRDEDGFFIIQLENKTMLFSGFDQALRYLKSY
jgi:hypothetical protein